MPSWDVVQFFSDLAGPAGFVGRPVGPYGTLSPFKSDPAGPDGPYVSDGPVGPFGTLPPSNSGGVFPLADPPPGSTLPPGAEGLPSCPDGGGTPAVVAMVGSTALPRSTDTTLVCVDECTDCDILDQFETINGMPVYYGGDLYDSDWDDPYAIPSVAYVEDHNFDVPEGMELMVYVRRRGPYGSDIREDAHTGLAHACQTSLCDTRDELDTVDVDSLTEAFAEDVQDTGDFYQRIVSSEEEDFGDPDDPYLVDIRCDVKFAGRISDNI